MRKPSKVQRMMAALPDDIAKKLFTSGDLVLPPMDYSILWNSVSPARFITRCIKFLLDYEKNPDDMAKNLKKTPDELRYFITCVLHSITVFDLFSVMDGRSEALAIALEKFDSVKKRNPQPNDKRIYKVLNALQKHRSTSEVPVVSMVVDCAALVDLPMSMGMSMLGAKATRQVSQTQKKYALDDCHEEFPFLFPFLQNLLTVTEHNGTSAAAVYAQQIFSEILKILSTLHHQLRMAPESIESVSVQALALMFMLKQFITIAPTEDIKFLRSAIDTISSFKAWPLPFSSAATDLLKMLEVECRAPGTSLREKLFLEDPELLPSSHVASPDDVHVLQVHVLVDREDPLSNTHQALFETVQQELGRKSSGNMLIISEEMDDEGGADESTKGDGSGAASEDNIPDLTPEHLRIRMVTHIISCDFDLTNCSNAEDPLDLGSRTPEEMLTIYEKALDIHAQVRELPIDDPSLHKAERGVPGGICKLMRENLVNELLNLIQPGHSFVPTRSAEDGRDSLQRKPSSFALRGGGMSDKTLDSLAGEDETEEEAAPVRPSVPSPDAEVGKTGAFENNFTPLMPPVQFKFWQCKTQPISKPNSKQITSNLYLYYKAECEQLLNLVTETVEKSVEGVKPVLKLVLMGSNLILHKYLCAYSAVYETQPDILNKVDLRLYICPEGQNDMGRFLAWSDAWYKRHVFSPFVSSVTMAPQYSIKETFPSSLLDECEMHTTLPVNLLREMLQHYVRTAEHTEMVRVYDVQCWTEQDENLRRMSTTGDNFLDNDGDFDLFGEDTGASEKSKTAVVEEKIPVFALTPNVIVPFITSLEIGILSQVEAYKYNMMKQGTALKDILSDKEFIRTHGGGSFPNLQISYRASNLNQKATRETKEIRGEFVSISVCNVPEGIRGFETSLMEDEEKFGTWSGLTLSVRRNQDRLRDIIGGKTKLTPNEADKFIEQLKNKDSFGIQSKDEEQDPHVAKHLIVGTVSIQVTRPKDHFYILADGALVGPLKKIQVGPSALKHEGAEQKSFEMPIQSFFPVAAFTREEEEDEAK